MSPTTGDIFFTKWNPKVFLMYSSYFSLATNVPVRNACLILWFQYDVTGSWALFTTQITSWKANPLVLNKVTVLP